MKKFKKRLSNERGSVLSVTLIVIALLSFSLSVVTGDTLNLTGQTTEIQENIQDTTYGKKILDIALAEMKDYILNSSSSAPVDAYFQDPATVEGTTYASFSTYIEESYGVSSEDVTLQEELDPLTQAAIKLSLLLEDGVTISRTTYYSFSTETDNNLTGSAAVAEILNDPEFDADDPYEINFYFSLVTNGDLIMNGGYYNFPAIYAANVYMHNRAPYVWNGDTSNQGLTPVYEGSDPRYKFDNFTKIFYDQEYQYCLDSGCITPGDANTDTIIHKNLYNNVEGSGYEYSGNPQDYKLDEFFTSFDFNQNFLDYMQNTAPNSTLDTTITMDNYESVILSNSVAWTSNAKASDGPFINVTNNISGFLSDNSKDYSVVIDARSTPFVLTEQMMMDSDAYTIVVLGDMIIDGAGAKNANQNEHTIIGNLIVTGDLLLTGGADMKSGDEMSLVNTIITLGSVTFDFDEGVGLDNTKNGSVNTQKFSGLVLLAKGNIIFKSFNQSHVPLTNEAINLYAFMYAEESVFIDAVNSHVRLEGAIYARARGVSGDYLPYQDEEGNQIHGIIINAFNGYINDSNVPNVNTSDIVRFHMTNLTVDRMQLAFEGLPRFEVKVRSDEYFVDDGYELE